MGNLIRNKFCDLFIVACEEKKSVKHSYMKCRLWCMPIHSFQQGDWSFSITQTILVTLKVFWGVRRQKGMKRVFLKLEIVYKWRGTCDQWVPPEMDLMTLVYIDHTIFLHSEFLTTETCLCFSCEPVWPKGAPELDLMTHVYIEHTICLYTESIIINLTLPLNVLAARNPMLATFNKSTKSFFSAIHYSICWIVFPLRERDVYIDDHFF